MYFVIPAYILDFLHVPAWQTAKFTLWNTFDMYKPNDVIFYQHLASDESVVDFMSLDGCPDYENIIPDILFSRTAKCRGCNQQSTALRE